MDRLLDSLFPSAEDIPETWRLQAPLEQRDYLVNGELRRWDGPLATVRSPVWLKEGNEERQVVLGSAPLLDADTALTALDAAVQAYDKGRGAWPNMRVAERIQHVEIYHEEQFGPLVPVVPYRDLQTVIDYVLDSDYGQQLSLFGNDPATIGSLVDIFANQVGRININAQCQRGPDTYPFNGRKNSAEGTLSVHDALRVFSIRTLVATRFQDANKALISDIIRNRQSSFLTTDYIF